MSLELVNNLLELAQKNMSEGDYLEAANLLKEKYKIIDEVEYETMILESPIEFCTDDERKLFTVRGFKYKKSNKELFSNCDCKYINGDFLLQVGEQEHCIKNLHFFDFIKTIIENDLLTELFIENSFYGKVKRFNTLNYVSQYRDICNTDDDDADYDFCILFDSYVKTQFANICCNTIRQTILRLFRTM
jgi:hypothetical protein